MADEVKEAAKNLEDINKLLAKQTGGMNDLAKMVSDGSLSPSDMAKLLKQVTDYKNALFVNPKSLGKSEEGAEKLRNSLSGFSDLLTRVSGDADATKKSLDTITLGMSQMNKAMEKGSNALKERQEDLQKELDLVRQKEKWWKTEKSLDDTLTEVIKKHGEIAAERTAGWEGFAIKNINDKIFEPLKNNPIIKLLGGSGWLSFMQGKLLEGGKRWLHGNRERRFDKQRVAVMNSHYKNLSTVTMGTIGEQKDQERLQKEILTTKDQEGKIDTEHWAFKQLVELMDNIGARANLELSKDDYEKNLEASFNKEYDSIVSTTTEALERKLTTHSATLEQLQTKKEELTKKTLETYSGLEGREGIEKRNKARLDIEAEYQEKISNIEKLLQPLYSEQAKRASWQIEDTEKDTELAIKIEKTFSSKGYAASQRDAQLKQLDQLENTWKDQVKEVKEIKEKLENQKTIVKILTSIDTNLKSGNVNSISQEELNKLQNLMTDKEGGAPSKEAVETGTGIIVKTLTKLLTGSGPVGEYIHKLWETTAKRDKKIGQQERSFSHPLSQKQGLHDEKASNLGDGVLGQFGKIGEGAKKLGGGGLLLLQKTIGGISGIFGKLMTPLKGMGGLLSGGGIAGFLTNLGVGIAGLLGSIAAIGPKFIALGLAGLTGISLNLLIIGNALKAAATGIGTILSGIGKVITSMGEGMKKGGKAIVDTFKGLAEVGWGGIVKGITTIAGLGLALRTFGKASIFAVPALLATGFMFKTLSGLFKSIPESDKLFDSAKGFVELAKGVRTFAMSSMLLLPALPLYAALSALPIVGKLIDLQKSKQSSINSNTGSVSINADNVAVSGSRLRSADSETRRLQKGDKDNIVAPVVATSTTDNSTTEINVAEAPLNILDYNQTPQQLYFA